MARGNEREDAGRGGRGRGRVAGVLAAVSAALGCSSDQSIPVDEPRQTAQDDVHLGTAVRGARRPRYCEVSYIV